MLIIYGHLIGKNIFYFILFQHFIFEEINSVQ